MRNLELTFALIKPHVIQNPFALRSVQNTIENHFKIVQFGKVVLTKEIAFKFYKEHSSRFFYNRLLTFVSRSDGAQIHRRPLEFAYDNSSSIDAVQEFLSVHHEVNFIGLIQCTSVFIKAKFLQAAYEKLFMADCVFSVTPNFKLRWSFDGNGQYLKPLNFNPRNRPRRQDWIGELVETGMFYFAKRQLILQAHILQNDRCKAVIIPPEESLEIDTLYELKIAKCLTES